MNQTELSALPVGCQSKKFLLHESYLWWAKVIFGGRKLSLVGESYLWWAKVIFRGRKLSLVGESYLWWAKVIFGVI